MVVFVFAFASIVIGFWSHFAERARVYYFIYTDAWLSSASLHFRPVFQNRIYVALRLRTPNTRYGDENEIFRCNTTHPNGILYKECRQSAAAHEWL